MFIMEKIFIDFKKKFKTEEFKILETEHWTWSLRPHQATLGSGILFLNRQCLKFSDLNKEEFADLFILINQIEKALSNLFSYDVINYLMLMMVDKQVHYHVIPRYQKGVFFQGKEWKDVSWPNIPLLSGELYSNDNLLKIVTEIKKTLG